MTKTESARRSKRLKIRNSKTQGAVERDKNSAEDIPPRKMPGRKLPSRHFLATCKRPNGRLVLSDLSKPDEDTIRDCAILAMQDYAIQEDCLLGLRFIKLLKVDRTKFIMGCSYLITFLGACDLLGETVYEAIVYNDMVERQVVRVGIPDPEPECYDGIVCIPLISINMDVASSSDVIPDAILAIGGDEDKLLLDNTNKSGLEAILKDCAILAMQDHAIQNHYYDGLRFIELLEYRISYVNACIYSITFRGASHKYCEATYEADVYDDKTVRKVGRVKNKTILPPEKWCPGRLLIPKVACQDVNKS